MLGSLEMQRSECEELLRAGVVGRVSVCTPTGPHIAPVAYAVIDDMIMFRTSTYSVLGTHGRNAVLAFEVDRFDDQARGWSVLATGRGEVITSEELLDQVREVWPMRPWSVGMRHLVMGVPSTVLLGTRTGRSDPA
jgi:nitroimidazol reductase NimA-like FMN-containing flavoprotein (pyridoxamine 5'-phosphate oxidase superfamily)